MSTRARTLVYQGVSRRYYEQIRTTQALPGLSLCGPVLANLLTLLNCDAYKHLRLCGDAKLHLYCSQADKLDLLEIESHKTRGAFC